MRQKALKIFYESKRVTNALPENFKQTDGPLFNNSKVIQLPQSGLYLLKNVFVTDLGIIYKNLSALRENIICYQIDFKNYRFRYFLKAVLLFKKKIYSGNKGLIVFDNYSGPTGFAHWLCDGLTRLAEMNETLQEYTIVVPYYFKEQAIYSETLKLFNVKAIHYLSADSLTYFHQLYFPSPIADTGNFNPENVIKLRQQIWSRINLPISSTRNIYISRAKASRRFVENEEDAVTLLKKYNFEIVHMQDHTFEEQVKIIYAANNIVSIHGAALAMLLFAKPGSSVLELKSDTDAINNMYYILANTCEINYYYLSCNSNEKSKNGNNFNLNVKLNDLEENLKRMLNKADR